MDYDTIAMICIAAIVVVILITVMIAPMWRIDKHERKLQTDYWLKQHGRKP